jgi:polysaccharide deacetylase family protein (PEP-CTERM system associated)
MIQVKNNSENIFLFSIDLEDVRYWMDDGLKYSERVPLMIERYLDFLDKHNSQATFFVVGDVARVYPALIAKIAGKGHEIACHSNKHLPLVKMDASSFKADLTENIKLLNDAGIKEVHGFRAPIYSMTEKTVWAYKVLADLGFTYSSSVFPAKNPMYGWPGFNNEPQFIENGIWEIPITLFKSKMISVPVAGGVYFRTLPFFITKKLLRSKWEKGLPVLGYFHPYDIDEGQEHFMHPGINNSRIYNFFMYYHRKRVFPRLEKVLKNDVSIITYLDYVKSFHQQGIL